MGIGARRMLRWAVGDGLVRGAGGARVRPARAAGVPVIGRRLIELELRDSVGSDEVGGVGSPDSMVQMEDQNPWRCPLRACGMQSGYWSKLLQMHSFAQHPCNGLGLLSTLHWPHSKPWRSEGWKNAWLPWNGLSPNRRQH